MTNDFYTPEIAGLKSPLFPRFRSISGRF
jgi:hypothetical protein